MMDDRRWKIPGGNFSPLDPREKVRILPAAAHGPLKTADLFKYASLDHEIAAARRQSPAIRPRLIAQLCLAQQHPHRWIKPSRTARREGQMYRPARHAALLVTRAAIQLRQPPRIRKLVVVQKRDPLSAGFANAAVAGRHDSLFRLVNAPQRMSRFRRCGCGYAGRRVRRAVVD